MSAAVTETAVRVARGLPQPDLVRAVLVRATNWVGDALLSTPAVAAVRRAFPAAHVVVLARPPVREVFAGSPDVDEVILAPARSFGRSVAESLALIGRLRQRAFDLAVLLPNAFEAALMVWLARIPHRVGYATDGRGPLLTVAVRRRAAVLGQAQVEYYLGLTDALGWSRAGERPRMPVGAAAEAEAAALLAGAAADRPRVALNPGSTYGTAKRWPAERYAALASPSSAAASARAAAPTGMRGPSPARGHPRASVKPR